MARVPSSISTRGRVSEIVVCASSLLQRAELGETYEMFFAPALNAANLGSPLLADVRQSVRQLVGKSGRNTPER